MKHLVLVTHYFSTHRGGVEKIAVELAKALANRHGWKVSWVASNVDPLPENLPTGLNPVPVPAWNILERKLGVPWPIWSLGGLRQLWGLVGQADIVHLHDALYFGNAFAWLFARLRGVPVIVTQHVGTVPYQSAFLRRIHALANRTLGRVVLSTANQVVFYSPAVRNEFEKFCRFRVSPVNVPNGVDTLAFVPDGPIAQEHAIDEARRNGRRVFIFVGRFVEKKGLIVLRRLAETFRDDLWIFAGWGPVDPEHWHLPNVLVVRGKSEAGLAPYYRAADLLILPSVGEGFPLVIQEAMACGTPVMVGEETASGSPEARPLMYVENVGTEDTATRWAARLDKIFADLEEMKSRRERISQFVQANWSWDVAARRYAELLDAQVSRIPSKSPAGDKLG